MSDADKLLFCTSSYAYMVEQTRREGVRVTVYGGEEPGEGPYTGVRKTIEELGAERIGHRIHVINDEATMQLLRDRNVALEVCPTSN